MTKTPRYGIRSSQWRLAAVRLEQEHTHVRVFGKASGRRRCICLFRARDDVVVSLRHHTPDLGGNGNARGNLDATQMPPMLVVPVCARVLQLQVVPNREIAGTPHVLVITPG